MYSRDREHDEYDRWRRYGQERGWVEKSIDELSSWFGNEEAERRRRIDREESERQERYGSSEGYGSTTHPYEKTIRNDKEYRTCSQCGTRHSSLGGRTYSTRLYDDMPHQYSGQWSGLGGRESEFMSSGGTVLSPWYPSYGDRVERGRRGPRNFRRADDRISDDIHEKIDRHPVIDARDVIVEVRDGEVVLKGSVPSKMDKRRIEEISDDVFGVKNVQNQLRVVRHDLDEPVTASTAGPGTTRIPAGTK